MVPVERQATGAGDPTGRKVEVLEHSATLRTTSGRIGGVYEGDLTTGAFSLVREVLPKRSPAAVQDALAQMMIAHHAAYAQVFQRDAVVLAHQAGAQLVQEVVTLIGNVRLLTMDGAQGLLPVGAAALSPRQLTLQDAQPPLPGAVEGRMCNLRALTSRQQRREAHVKPDCFPGLGQRFWFRHFAGKAGVPPPGLVLDANGLDHALQRSMPADAHSPDAVQLQPSPVQAHPHAELLEQKAVEAVAAFEARIAGLLARLDAPEERLKRQIDLLDDTLRRLAEHLIGVGERPAVVFGKRVQLRSAHPATFELVGDLALGQRHVVQAPAGVQHAPQVGFLRARRVEAVAVGAEHSDCLLTLDVLLNHRQRRAANSRDKIAVRPQRWQTAFQMRELLTKQARAATLDALNKFVDAELWVYFAQQMYMIRHHFQFQHFASCFVRNLLDDSFQSLVHAVYQHLAAVFRAKDDVVLAGVDHAVVALEFALLSHNNIIQQEVI